MYNNDQQHKIASQILSHASFLHNYIHRHIKKYGLSFEQFNVLRTLEQHTEPLSLSKVAEGMAAKHSNTTRIVKILRRKGLVIHMRNTFDERQVDITITQQGLDILRNIKKDNQLFPSALSSPRAEKLCVLMDEIGL